MLPVLGVDERSPSLDTSSPRAVNHDEFGNHGIFIHASEERPHAPALHLDFMCRRIVALLVLITLGKRRRRCVREALVRANSDDPGVFVGERRNAQVIALTAGTENIEFRSALLVLDDMTTYGSLILSTPVFQNNSMHESFCGEHRFQQCALSSLIFASEGYFKRNEMPPGSAARKRSAAQGETGDFRSLVTS